MIFTHSRRYVGHASQGSRCHPSLQYQPRSRRRCQGTRSAFVHATQEHLSLDGAAALLIDTHVTGPASGFEGVLSIRRSGWVTASCEAAYMRSFRFALVLDGVLVCLRSFKRDGLQHFVKPRPGNWERDTEAEIVYARSKLYTLPAIWDYMIA